MCCSWRPRWSRSCGRTRRGRRATTRSGTPRLGSHLGQWSLELDLRHWVNDGLMAMFFLVVGLEVKRELLLGELRERRRAVLPIVAAVGGMVVPALIYVALNPSGPEADGLGHPDGDRHRLRRRGARPGRAVDPVRAPPVPAHAGHRRRHRCDPRDRGLLLVVDRDRRGSRWRPAIVVAVLVLRRAGFTTTPLFVILGVCVVARGPRVGGARDDRRRGHGPARARHARADARDRAVADRRARSTCSARSGHGDLPHGPPGRVTAGVARAPAARLVEPADRPGVRAGQRRRRAHRRHRSMPRPRRR